MRCWFMARLLPALGSPVPIYTPGWREALWELSVWLKNITELGPIDPDERTNHETNVHLVSSAYGRRIRFEYATCGWKKF